MIKNLLIKQANFLPRYIAAFTLLILAGCVSTEPFYSRAVQNWEQNGPDASNKLLYTVFLIGDVGAPDLEGEPSMILMRKQMEEAGMQSATIFLGDNVYHNGLPPVDRYDREISEKRLNAQLDILKGYEGEKYMIPGNHDWNHSGRGGLDAVMREQRYVNEYLTDENIVVGGDFFVPGDGCPGPYEVKISDDLVLIAIDSEWWLHPFDRPYGDNSSCGAATELDFLIELEDIIEKNSGSDIMVVAHHPMLTRGNHGGFFTFKDHVFPFTMLRDWMYLPLPGIGSIYPFARKYGGILQDIPHPRYKAYIEGLTRIFSKYDNIIYAAGHEHGLEYFNYQGTPLIVSGSGCKIQYLKEGGDHTEYLQAVKGFAKVLYYENGDVWTEFWAPEGKGETGRMTYRVKSYSKKPRKELAQVEDNTNYADSTITISANPRYKAPLPRKVMLGKQYRDEWATEVEVPLLDLKNEFGGLTPYMKGGGKQTATLKVRNPDAKEYILRTVDKDPTQVLPIYLRQAVTKDKIQDQVTAQHPYGALIIPKLADAVGIYHTNPKLVYIPNTPLLRQYADEFGNTLAYLEEDADENHEDVASLGNATNLVGTDKVLEELEEDNDNEVAQEEYVRARLFDMLIGDWDRHEGQWRWVEEKKEGKGKRYIPVPEDRDHAFYKIDGVLPWLITRKWGVRNVQNFGYEFRDIVGLNLNGLTLDRTLTSKVTKEDWVKIAQDMKNSLTDEAITEALSVWPEDIRKLSGEEIAAKLRARREQLPAVANDYYNFLARYVDISGSDKHERFEINRLSNEQVQITGYKLSKEGEVLGKLYERTFYTEQTKEVRIYGMDGKDEFILTGNVDKSLVVRIIAGGDKDLIVDKSSVSGWKEHTIVYDTEEGNEFNFSEETKDETEPYPEVNLYDRANYVIPYFRPRLSVEYNIDDGFVLGAGGLLRTFAFRKKPYAAEQLLKAAFAFGTSSFDINYSGDFRQVFGEWNMAVNTTYKGPDFQRNFYGIGNFTEQSPDLSDEFYQVRYERFNLGASLYKDISSILKIGIGPTYDRFQINQPTDLTFLLQEGIRGNLVEGTYDLSINFFNVMNYAGIKAYANLNVLGGGSSYANPDIGMRWLNTLSYNKQIGNEELSFTNVNSEFSFYISPNFPFQLTWAGRIGGSHNFGDYRFYQANTLGGTDNLRGYRRTRFAGTSSIYANGEARVELLNYNLYLAPGKMGVLGFLDAGRVYYKEDPKHSFFRSLHTGYGGGIWIDTLSRSVISLTYANGEEDELWMLKFGFFF